MRILRLFLALLSFPNLNNTMLRMFAHLLALFAVVLAASERFDFINENVEILTTLTTSNVHQDIKVTAKSLEKPGNYWLSFADPRSLDNSLTFIQVKGGAHGKGKQVLPVSRGTGYSASFDPSTLIGLFLF